MASESNTAIIAALFANLGIAVAKFVGAVITGSSAMISEGIHSIVDTGNQLLLLLGQKKSQLPPDTQHPFGHGQDFYFWTLIVAILLFSLGGGMSFYEGIHHLQNPESVVNPTANYIILGVSVLFEGTSWFIAFKRLRSARYSQKGRFFQSLRRSKDPGTFVILFEDTAALLGLIIAALGVFLSTYFNNPALDAYASMAIGVILAIVAVLLANESRGLLIGESANKQLVENICQIVKNDAMVEDSKAPLSMHFGPEEILLALDVEFKEGRPGDIETAIERLEKKIKHTYPEVKRIFIEARLLE